ncbi:MAG: hypothetical protein D4R64_06515 [Porphyromonadaceae bacterium]|nr:MAG: hypothetical protein D4R64_06515 [Porphyromonadaceae bacterium]
MIKKIWILLSLSFLISFTVFGQEKEKKKNTSEAADTTIVLSKGRIVYKNRIYRQNASYLTIAYGTGYGFESKLIEQNMTLSYQQFIKKIGLQLGYHSSSDTKIWWRSYQKLNDLYLGIGKRWESPRYNLSVFGGPSLAYGSYIAWNAERQKDWAYGFLTGGFHAEAQATYKIAYDIGIGLSLYGSVNRYYSVTGAQIHLFFSTAFVRNY